jgi:nitrogen fixation NifU-like protein
VSTYYKDLILDHYKHPRNFGDLSHADLHAHEANPLCGDIVDIKIKFSGDKIADIKSTGEGCAISTAATSLLTEYLKPKTKNDLKEITPETIFKLLGAPVAPGRLDCALLPLHALRKAVKSR